MTSFHSDRYLLRSFGHLPSELGLGGMYATAEAPKRVVRVEPREFPFMERQVASFEWLVQSVPEKGENVVTIQADRIDAVESTFWHNLGDEAPIVLDGKKYFRLELIQELEGKCLYTISPYDAPQRIGTTCYVGADKENIVSTNWYPVIEDMVYPVWAFYPAKYE